MTMHRLITKCVLLLALAGCAVMSPANDPRPVTEIIDHAEGLVASLVYAEAAAQYAIVIDKEPAVGKHHLRRAELLERIDADMQAYQTYRQALNKVAETDPDHLAIVHRLALLNANHLSKNEEARDLLKRLPDGSLEKLDLEAFFYYQSGHYKQAIVSLNKGLELAKNFDHKALLLYHAALVYDKLDDRKNAYGSLYHSVNNAKHLGLTRDIEQLWNKLNESPEP